VTILLGLFAIAARQHHHALAAVPYSARVLVIAALALLFTATVSGIMVGFPLAYFAPEAAPLDRLVADDIWRGSGVKTAQRIAKAKLLMLRKARQSTRLKAVALTVGLTAEAVAVALVAAAVTVVLL
jgi:hypothetical protein